MYRSVIDHLADRIQASVYALAALRTQLRDPSIRHTQELQPVRESVDQQILLLNLHLTEVRDLADETRMSYARDRAWQLLGMDAAGALDPERTYELLVLTERETQDTFQFSEDLRTHLNDPVLLQRLYASLHPSGSDEE